MTSEHVKGMDQIGEAKRQAWMASFEQYLEQERKLSRCTLTAYRRAISQALSFFDQAGRLPPFLLAQSDLYQWIGHLRQKKQLSSRSIALYLSAFRSFLKWYGARCHPLILPKLKLKTPADHLPAILTPDEVVALLQWEPRHPRDYRDQAILECFYSSGLRLHELAKLQYDEIIFSEHLVRVVGKGGKVRWTPMGEKALEAIRRWRHHQQGDKLQPGFIFTNPQKMPLSHRAIQKSIARWAYRQLKRTIYPHALRHAFATHLLGSCKNIRAIQEMLGHAKLSTTQKYLHLDLRHLLSTYDAAHPRQRQRALPPTDAMEPCSL